MKRKSVYIPPDPSEITPRELYYSRREFLKAAGIVSASALVAACAPKPAPAAPTLATTAEVTPEGLTVSRNTDELGDPLNTFYSITHYNNYYEFTTSKPSVATVAKDFKTSPWSVEISGLVKNPLTLSVDELIRRYPPEERIYRLRCVEAWSMVVPWLGFPLLHLLDDVKPTADAKFVAFSGVLDKADMPGQRDPFFDWPYREGLRLDEAQNGLAILATGLYGIPLLPQDGAPIRLVVPWKYGFKSIKAVTKIELIAERPKTTWNSYAPDEYGFFANVNPKVDHPRWSQATELRIGESFRRDTLLFNGYTDQVSYLYAGMDLTVSY